MVAVQSTLDERTVLHHISWETYQHILRDHEYRSTPRFSYDRGTLEIMSPLPIHERYNRFVQLFVSVVSEETNIDVFSFGSTTFTSEEAQRGFEPDSCFYIANGERVRDKRRIDLRVDPPPDLVFEVDVTHSSLDKLALYRQAGVPEVWRYNGERVEFLLAGPDGYVLSPQSAGIPRVRAEALKLLLDESGGLSDSAWLRRVRRWLRELPSAEAG